MAAFISWLGGQFARPMVRTAAQKGTEFVREMVAEGITDAYTSTVKEHTGVAVKTPPPSTPTAAAGALAYHSGKYYLMQNQAFLTAKYQQIANGPQRTRPEMNQFIASQERFIHE